MKCIAGYWWISQYNFIPRNTCTASCLILFARNIQFYRKGHMPCLVWRIFLCMLKGGSCVYSITVLQFYSAHGCSRRVVLWSMLLVNNIEVSIHSAEELCEQFSHLCERESKFFLFRIKQTDQDARRTTLFPSRKRSKPHGTMGDVKWRHTQHMRRSIFMC
jgi:hypothetical protein